MELLRHGPGRPRKYGRASRAVTITLPEDVIARLRAANPDVGRAIVSLADHRGRARTRGRPARPAELAAYGKHAVIIVSPVRALKRLPGVQLVPVGGGRALISLARGGSVPQLELDIRDAIDRMRGAGPERQTLQMLARILREARVSRRVTLEERTIIVLESKRQRRKA